MRASRSGTQQDKANLKVRLETLHAIEQGGNEPAEIAELISTAVLRRHLETMERLDIEYDFLPRESEILRLHFWNLAFEQLKEKKVLYFETEGKNKGCWVMTRPAAGSPLRASSARSKQRRHANAAPPRRTRRPRSSQEKKRPARTRTPKSSCAPMARSAMSAKTLPITCGSSACSAATSAIASSSAIRIGTRSWISAEDGEPDHPHFGGVSEIYNVIDARQSDPQNTVIEALRLLGYTDQADHYTHFSYEMVALTPRCAIELGYEVSEEDRQRAYIEVSGRKGFGVKADDLMDRLISAAVAEVDARHPELSPQERAAIGRQIALGALRYFMLKFTKQSVIAFDFREALAFEGETGPYAQYAIVRARNIFRKGGTSSAEVLAGAADADFAPYFEGEVGTEIWQLWLLASQTSSVIEQCISTTEPAHLAKHAFQLAQQFNNFYHRHHILTEPDAGRKQFLLATAAIVERELIRALKVMGIEAPEVM